MRLDVLAVTSIIARGSIVPTLVLVPETRLAATIGGVFRGARSTIVAPRVRHRSA